MLLFQDNLSERVEIKEKVNEYLIRFEKCPAEFITNR